MRKGVDGGYGESVFIGIWVEGIEPLMRRLARPYFRVGFTLSVCLSVPQQAFSCVERVFYTYMYIHVLVSVAAASARGRQRSHGATLGG